MKEVIHHFQDAVKLLIDVKKDLENMRKNGCTSESVCSVEAKVESYLDNLSLINPNFSSGWVCSEDFAVEKGLTLEAREYGV